MSFSDRIGKTQPSTVVQVDSMDLALRNQLWNLVARHYVNPMANHIRTGPYDSVASSPSWEGWRDLVWDRFFKQPIDESGSNSSVTRKTIREWFFSAEWWNVYNFLEFAPKAIRGGRDAYYHEANEVLERELSGFRFIEGVLTPVSDETEVEAVEQALEAAQAGKLAPVRQHPGQALVLFSDRKDPDYRNSIKESISAIEALVGLISGSGSTLGQTIKIIDKHLPIHPALQSAFSAMYGWTSDGGIRHALAEGDIEPQFEDAKFMLVACSAFVNFLVGKAAKAKLQII